MNQLTIDNDQVVNYSKIINFYEYSSVNRAVKTLIVIGNFVHLLKLKLFQKDPIKYSHFNVPEQKNKYHYWENKLLAEDQQKEFPELFTFNQNKMKSEKFPP